MSDDEDRHGSNVAISTLARGTTPHPDMLEDARRSVDREPDITAGRELAHHVDVVVTEAYDDSNGTSHVRHAGEDPKLHRTLLIERAHGQRHRISEEQRTRRLLALLACLLVLGSAVILAFAPQGTNVYLGAAALLGTAGAFGVKAFRIKVRGLEIDVGK